LSGRGGPGHRWVVRSIPDPNPEDAAMTRSLLAALLCASLALAAPARADDRRPDGRDLAVILGGAVALYVLNQTLRDRRGRAPVTRGLRDAPVPRRPRDRHGNALLLPDRCLQAFQTPRGTVRGYGARCMQRFAPDPRLLPAECVDQVRTADGIRTFYGPRCLRRAGWSPRTARR
jgi:hypothetical protein